MAFVASDIVIGTGSIDVHVVGMVVGPISVGEVCRRAPGRQNRDARCLRLLA